MQATTGADVILGSGPGINPPHEAADPAIMRSGNSAGDGCWRLPTVQVELSGVPVDARKSAGKLALESRGEAAWVIEE
jgi:hypothetical protein